MLVFVGIYIGQRLAEISVSEREHISIYDQTTYEFNTRLIVGAKLDEIISDLKLKYKHSLIKIYVVCDESLNIDPNLIADPLIHLLNFNDIDFTHYLSKEVDPKKKIVFVNKNSMLYEYVNTKNRILEYKPMKCFEGPFVKENYLKLMLQFFEYEIQLNTFNFELCKIIPSSRAIETYKPQTRLMGIDLGASRIVVSVSRNGHTELVKIDQEYSMPSVISFVEDEPIVGNVAVRHLAKNPELVLCDFEDLSDKRKNLSGYSLPFGQLIESKKSSFVFQSKELLKQFSTIEIYEILLQKLKQEASEFQFDLNEGKDVNQVVITVPNFDNDLMLKDIFAAAESVGLKILDIVTETHADLLYFLSNKQFSIGETVAVVDIGGGTGFIEKFSFKKGFHEKLDFSFLCAREINTHLEWALELLFYERFEIWPTFNAEQKLEVEKIKENFTFAEK
uniref:Cell division protein FtsA n=1 Tax=Panagrolaimus sp. JU765 TaxID=591449 RepID=A0AC34Q764_9BILA